MRRTRGQEIRRLQKKLIPVNLLVCIICVVASLSLFFMPIVKINLTTVVGDKTLRQIVTDIAVEKINAFIDQAGDSIDGSLGGSGESGSGTDSGTDGENSDGGNVSGGVEAQLEENGETPENPDVGNTEGGNEGGSTEGGSTEGGSTESGDESGDGSEQTTIKDLLKGIDVRDLVSKLVGEIFDELDANISVSSMNSLKVFRAQDKADTLLNELFFNEAKGFVANLEKTLISGFGNAFNEAGKLLQGAVVKVMVVPALKKNLPKEYADLVVAEELQAAIDDLDNAKSAQEASDTIINYINSLSENSTEIDKLTPEKEADITKQISEIYDKTVAETGEGNFTVEAMITVMASEMLGGVGDFNLSEIIAGFAKGGSGSGSGNGNGSDGDGGAGDGSQNNEENEPNAQAVKLLVLSKLMLVDGEATEGGNGGNAGESGSGAEGGTEGGEVSDGDKEVTKYTTYRAMGEGLAKNFIGEDLQGSIKVAIMHAVGENEAVFGYYGYIFIAIGFFIILWAILFLFAFFHMFAKNKRFMMWYVKLFCLWPCTIFYFVPLFIKKVLAVAFPEMYEQVMKTVVEMLGSALKVGITTEQASGIFNALLSSFQTFAWISGICYLLLWIISVCWAFPIKHKIRKLKKG